MRKKKPVHVAIIMDGNRRWAKKAGLSEIDGHRRGVETLVEISKEALRLGARYLTVYALSTENYQARAKDEIKGLLHLVSEGYVKYLPRLKKDGIRLNFIGDLESLPALTKRLINQAEKELARGDRGVLNIAINYGSRGEIVEAAKRISEKNLEFTEKNLHDSLYTGQIPEPDLLIRTGGEKRLSNFLLWQASYAELYFTDTLWPDFDKEEFAKAIEEFAARKRNFGL
ncbi:MAG: polyprenyl diphosphate synthase [Candidatus Woykebacteria bacterium]